ncbi:TIGR02588 family protein [Leptolyngbya sp. BC1307]|uniref:TIGR02588 family protein n=1 Tax=Leptolyngbya sp. BC1307 TaxID=2029589 RepID=UPI000EFCD0A4|nr:TIGR02588 family protein [Leptolyngbya sp. BC1307]
MAADKSDPTASETAEQGTTDSKAARSARSLAEWVTLSLSALVLTAIISLVLYDWQISRSLPPAFQVEMAKTTRLTEGHYYVPFTLHNTGGRIARTVQVVAKLHLPDNSDETGEQQFDFLSGNERKRGEFVFEHNPQAGELVIRVASFGLP